ncbi:PKD domain-containing protein [Propioniciclava soli]|uniref:PKD domain-containing protein n=1 Tax=Propioniciclava soli TaxID=2775081 RepID=A0ABZ3C8T2_9ACTN
MAAVSASTGAVLPFAADATGGYGVKGIVVSPDGSKVVIAGDFTAVDGSTNPGRGLAALDASTGALMPWLANSVVRNADTRAGMYSISSDGDSVYSTGWDYGGGAEDGFEGTVRMSWEDGSIVWLEDCHGDSYDVASSNDTVYSIGHDHYCGNIGGFPQTQPWTFSHSVAFTKAPSGQLVTADIYGYRSFTGMQAPRPLNWYPQWVPGTYTGQSQAGWTIETNSDYVVIGGEFPKVNDLTQQGLVRFATRAKAPKKMGPRTRGGAWPLGVSSYRPGEARLVWKANYDLDDSDLKYEVFRQDKGFDAPLTTFQQLSTFFKMPALTYTDKGLVPGQTYNYTVRVTDPDGNSTRTDWMPVTIAASDIATPYTDAVTGSAPVSYWPLNDDLATVAFDWANGQDQTVSNATRRVPGQQLNATSFATTFAGNSTSFSATGNAVTAPQVFTIEAWFNTTSTSGGKVVGYGSAKSGNSGSYDRQVYLNGQGTVSFGVYPGAAKVVSSAPGYNDGQWHHVVASLGADGQTLWIDGRLIGRDSTVTSAQAYDGYWRVGGDNLSGWPNLGTTTYLAGSIADVAVYDRVLTMDEVDAHRIASGRTSAIPPRPSDAYGGLVYDLQPTLYWRLGESAGPTANDAGRNWSTGTYGGNIVRYGVPGGLASVTDTAVELTGSSSRVIGAQKLTAPAAFAVETWIKTTSSTGGRIVGFGTSGTATLSTQCDRHLYMDNRGIVSFGVTSGGVRKIINSKSALNDGAWHHLVGQLSPDGMQYYVDGMLQGTDATQTADSYLGFWRVGGDNTWAGDRYFDGFVDEVAVYQASLSAPQIWEHYDLGRTGVLNQPPVVSFTPTMSNLTLSADASASADPDGSIVSYQWDLGDGSTGSGPVLTKEYAQPGIYQVTLTVTDNRGGVAVQTIPVMAKLPNVLPTSYFVAAPQFLSVDFDGSPSTDSDGTIVSHAWSFGDGTAATGANVNHVYSAPGTYEVTLTVTDDRGDSSISTQSITLDQAPNQLPTATLATSVEGRALSVDSAGSHDPDGTLQSVAWDFGDGGTASGPTATHTYAADGRYTVTLTVTDNRGGVATATKQVEARGFVVVAADSFSRSLATSWGNADQGGTWMPTSGTAYSVSDGAGRLALQPSWVREVTLPSVSSKATRTSVAISSDSAFNGGVQSFTVFGRQVGSSSYAARVRIESGGIRLYILRDEMALSGRSYMIPNYVYQAGDAINVRLDVVGTSPTTVEGRIWVNGTPMPTTPNLSATDNTAALQVPGRVGLKASLSSAAVSNATISFRDYSVMDPTPAPANVAPVAVFTPSVTGLSVAVDGSASSDSDGSIVSYAWDFGDGALGTGATVSHAYAAAGTFQVKLTVTDDRGGVHSVTKPVTVVAPPANVAPVAVFTPSVTGLSVAVDGSASSDSDGSIVSYAWDFGDGALGTGATVSHAYAAAGTFQVKLTVTDDRGGVHSVTKPVTVVAPPANVAPVAVFTPSVTGLSVAVDGSASSDSDGSIVSYAWDFGDGALGTGATVSHAYAAAGTFQVKLTVTDDRGGVHSVTKPVTVVAPEVLPIVKDSFERTVAGGWGTSDLGGDWTLSGGSAAFAVENSQGVISLAPSHNREARLNGVTSTATLSQFDLTVDEAPATAAMHVTLIGRQVGSSYYGGRVRLETSGAVRLYALRGETALANSYVLPGRTFVAGDRLRVKVQVSGTQPTVVKVKAWFVDQPEPTTWQIDTKDSTAAMQAPGTVGIKAVVGSSSTVPVTHVRIDDLTVNPV